jgi:hypothetical protein
LTLWLALHQLLLDAVLYWQAVHTTAATDSAEVSGTEHCHVMHRRIAAFKPLTAAIQGRLPSALPIGRLT